MVFSSVPFLFYFLPAVLILYFMAPARLKNAVLLFSSLIFYAWGEPLYVFLMIAEIAAGYLLGLLIERTRGKKICKLYLASSVAIPLLFLAYFKYADFFISSFSAAFGISLPLLGIALPIGISFYTFQLISYTVDVFRGEKAQKNPINLAAYIALFPQLIAGPIVRYGDIANQLEVRRHSFDKVAGGIRRFIIGLAKKILIANQLGELVDAFASSGERARIFFWIYAFAVFLQIYFDFSAYSDMAIGLGKIFGFDFCENFNYPIISKSIAEFWRRWHISLGTWFRDYVYIPLGGNRVPKARWILNILAVWAFTGLWHGAAWSFVIWGLFFALLLMGERLIWGKLIEKNGIISHIYVIILILISFVIFDSSSLSDAFIKLGAMFGSGKYPLINAESLYYIRSFSLLLVGAALGATPLPKKLFSKGKAASFAEKAEPFFLLFLLVLICAYLADGSFNPFLYFRF